jgi:hypothetical protein
MTVNNKFDIPLFAGLAVRERQGTRRSTNIG